MAASTVAIFWGLSFIGSKKALSAGMQTFSLVAVRFLVTVAALIPVARATGEKLDLRMRDFLHMIVTAITGITLYYYLELKGLMLTSASVAPLNIATIPVFSLLTGVYLLAFTDVGENTVAGCLCLFGACVSWVIYLEVTDCLLKRYSRLAVTFWQSVLGLITSVPFALAEDVRWAEIPLDAWLWACVFLGLVCSVLGFILNNYSIYVLSPQMSAVFLNLSPVATVAGEMIVFGENVAPMQLLGGAVILASLYVISGI